MIAYLKEFVKWYEARAIKLNLLFLSLLLSVFTVWLSNAEVLPLASLADFAFLAVLVSLFSLYRPGWAFLLLVASLPLEIINLAPLSLGVAVRPYQLLGALSLLALALRKMMGRSAVELPRFAKADALVIVFIGGGFLGALAAPAPFFSLKQAVVAASFGALYFLARIFVSSRRDIVKVAPFFFAGASVSALYAIWQNWRFVSGLSAFEVMGGRPNAAFAEPDWLGIFLVFVLAMSFAAEFFLARGRNKKGYLSSSFVLAVLLLVALILTVARSAWLGAAFVALGYLKMVFLGERLRGGSWDFKGFCRKGALLGAAFAVAVLAVKIFSLSSFELASRAQSVAGLQKITVSCQDGKNLPEKIDEIEELAAYGCRHIDLEEIEEEKVAGRAVLETYRPDPNVGIRANIYRTALAQIREHWFLGIGWGSIGAILGSDERGAALNASNIFLETWLGAGIFGIFSLAGLFAILVFYGMKAYFHGRDAEAAFLLLGVSALIIPNLFNSGIFLGFLWIYLGAAGGMLTKKRG